MAAIIMAFAGGFGAIVGSFLNVVIYRLPRGEPLGLVRKSRSGCPSCDAQILWYDNIPLVSWFVLRGRCRACGWGIPLRYPLVEGLTATLFAVTAGRAVVLGWSPLLGALVAAAVFTAILVSTAAIAIQHNRIPGGLLLTGGLLAIVPAVGLDDFPLSELGYDMQANIQPALVSLLAAAAGSGLAALALVGLRTLYRVFRSAAIGSGCVGLGAAAGAWLGPRLVVTGLVVGFLTAVLVGAILCLLTRRRERSLAPFLAAGFWVAALWGEALERLILG